MTFVFAAAQDKTSRYAFYASTWDGRWESSRNYQKFDVAHYLVSVPDGNRVFQGDASYPGLSHISPDGQSAIRTGTSDHPELTVFKIWDGSQRTFTFDQQVSHPFVWSPDSRYFTAAVSAKACKCQTGNPRELGIVEVATGELRVLTEGEFFVVDSATAIWSPYSTSIAYVEQRLDADTGVKTENVKIIPIDGSQPPRTLYTFTTTGDWARPIMHWLPDGKHIALRAWITGTSELWYVDVETAQVTYHHQWFDPSDICWSTVTDHFVLASLTGFKLMTPDGTPPLDVSFVDPSVWQLKEGSTLPCAWSPDGTKLVLVYHNAIPSSRIPPGAKVIDFAQRQVFDIEVGVETVFWTPYWSHDSRMLALRSYEISRDPTNVYIYDTVTMQQVLAQTDLEFIAWVANPPQ